MELLQVGLRESDPGGQRRDNCAELIIEHQPRHVLGPLARCKPDRRIMRVTNERHECRVASDPRGQRRLSKLILEKESNKLKKEEENVERTTAVPKPLTHSFAEAASDTAAKEPRKERAASRSVL